MFSTSPRIVKLDNTRLSFLKGFKISGINKLILALIFRFGVILVLKIVLKV